MHPGEFSFSGLRVWIRIAGRCFRRGGLLLAAGSCLAFPGFCLAAPGEVSRGAVGPEATDQKTEPLPESGAVEQLQARLKVEGFYSGPLDGQMTEATAGALRRFQMRAGLAQTGALDPDTVRALESTKEAGGGQAGGGAAPVAVADSGHLPLPYPAERYQAMIEQSPFSLATPVAATTEPEPNFAMNLYVKGIAKFRYPDGREVDYVSITSRSDNATFVLEGSTPNKDGIALAGVEWVDGLKSRVNLRKGGEVGTLEFDQANVRGGAGAPGGTVSPGGSASGMPAVGAQAGAVPPFPGVSGQRPANRPSGTGLVTQPINGAGRPAVPLPGKNGTLSAPGPTSVRQRIRPISSGQGMLKPQQSPSR
jgi:peptidoglycan hydrolase-like protein with peptidoglycan-binding domain